MLGKYTRWSSRRFWWSWFKQDVKRFILQRIYGLNMNAVSGTLLPYTGKGKYVSVYSKAGIIQIKHESGYEDLVFDEIRIIPCQYNHGVMVERFIKGRMVDRHTMDLTQFNKDVIFASNVEQLTQRHTIQRHTS